MFYVRNFFIGPVPVGKFPLYRDIKRRRDRREKEIGQRIGSVALFTFMSHLSLVSCVSRGLPNSY